MPAWQPDPDKDPPFVELGGNCRHPLSDEERRALARAGFADPGSVARQKAIDQANYSDFLSGAEGATHDGPGHAEARRVALVSTVLGLDGSGVSPGQQNAILRSRRERR